MKKINKDILYVLNKHITKEKKVFIYDEKMFNFINKKYSKYTIKRVKKKNIEVKGDEIGIININNKDEVTILKKMKISLNGIVIVVCLNKINVDVNDMLENKSKVIEMIFSEKIEETIFVGEKKKIYNE